MVADRLAGIAHVFVIESAMGTFSITEALGKPRSVFHGAVRLYWPGLTKTDYPKRHPLWIPRLLEGSLSSQFHEYLFNELAPIASFRVPIHPLEARIRQSIDVARRQELDLLRQRSAADHVDPEWEKELERSWAAETDLRWENERLSADIEILTKQLATSLENVSHLSASLGTRDADVVSHVELQVPIAPPSNVREAVERAENECSSLIFLPESHTSAADCPYRLPDKILEALRKFDDIAARFQRGDLPGGIREACRQEGLKYAADISETAKGKFRRSYEITYRGKRVLLGPHLVLGKGQPNTCARIYFYIDEVERVIAVGHVGRHLPDTTT
jgi:hypothetical protein